MENTHDTQLPPGIHRDCTIPVQKTDRTDLGHCTLNIPEQRPAKAGRPPKRSPLHQQGTEPDQEDYAFRRLIRKNDAKMRAAMRATLGRMPTQRKALQEWREQGGSPLPAKAWTNLFPEGRARKSAESFLMELRNRILKAPTPEARTALMETIKSDCQDPLHAEWRQYGNHTLQIDAAEDTWTEIERLRRQKDKLRHLRDFDFDVSRTSRRIKACHNTPGLLLQVMVKHWIKSDLPPPSASRTCPTENLTHGQLHALAMHHALSVSIGKRRKGGFANKAERQMKSHTKRPRKKAEKNLELELPQNDRVRLRKNPMPMRPRRRKNTP